MPQSRAKLDSNLQQFEAALAATDKQVSNELAPLKGKGYFVFHDAYGYFEKHYGLTSLGHFTVNPEIQPGAQRLHEIRTQLVEQKATCVFAEPQFRPAVIEAVARGTSVRMGTWIHWVAELSWVKRVTRNSSPSWRISIRAA